MQKTVQSFCIIVGHDSARILDFSIKVAIWGCIAKQYLYSTTNCTSLRRLSCGAHVDQLKPVHCLNSLIRFHHTFRWGFQGCKELKVCLIPFIMELQSSPHSCTEASLHELQSNKAVTKRVRCRLHTYSVNCKFKLQSLHVCKLFILHCFIEPCTALSCGCTSFYLSNRFCSIRYCRDYGAANENLL